MQHRLKVVVAHESPRLLAAHHTRVIGDADGRIAPVLYQGAVSIYEGDHVWLIS